MLPCIKRRNARAREAALSKPALWLSLVALAAGSLVCLAEGAPPRRGWLTPSLRNGPGTARRRGTDADGNQVDPDAPQDWRFDILPPTGDDVPELEEGEAPPWPRVANDPFRDWRPTEPFTPTRLYHQQEPLWPVIEIPEILQGYRVTRPYYSHFMPQRSSSAPPNLHDMDRFHPLLERRLIWGDRKHWWNRDRDLDPPGKKNAATQTSAWTDKPEWMPEDDYTFHMHCHHIYPRTYCHRPHLYERGSERVLEASAIPWEQRTRAPAAGPPRRPPDGVFYPERPAVARRRPVAADGGDEQDGEEEDRLSGEESVRSDYSSGWDDLPASSATSDYGEYDYGGEDSPDSAASTDDVGIYSDLSRGRARETQSPKWFNFRVPIRRQDYYRMPSGLHNIFGRLFTNAGGEGYLAPAQSVSFRDRSHFNAGFVQRPSRIWREFSELSPTAFLAVGAEGVPGREEPVRPEPEDAESTDSGPDPLE